MKRWLYAALCIAATACATACATASRPRPDTSDAKLGTLAWLSGDWIVEHGKTVTEEHWSDPRGASMLGTNRTIVQGETQFFEFLRIEGTKDGVIYHAAPRGRSPATDFRLVTLTDAERDGRVEHIAVFENQEHDYPQRITYRQQGDTLTARVEGTKLGNPVHDEWTFKRR